MRVKGVVRDIDLGFKKARSEILGRDALGGAGRRFPAELTIGVFGDLDENAPQKARYAEFGTRTAPRRPFLSTTFDRSRREAYLAFARAFGASLLKRGVSARREGLEAAGRFMGRRLQESIESWSSPPNAASTVRKKGFNNPLIETGSMLRSVGYRIGDAGKPRRDF